jgi:hypothetical protein
MSLCILFSISQVSFVHAHFTQWKRFNHEGVVCVCIQTWYLLLILGLYLQQQQQQVGFKIPIKTFMSIMLCTLHMTIQLLTKHCVLLFRYSQVYIYIYLNNQ